MTTLQLDFEFWKVVEVAGSKDWQLVQVVSEGCVCVARKHSYSTADGLSLGVEEMMQLKTASALLFSSTMMLLTIKWGALSGQKGDLKGQPLLGDWPNQVRPQSHWLGPFGNPLATSGCCSLFPQCWLEASGWCLMKSVEKRLLHRCHSSTNTRCLLSKLRKFAVQHNLETKNVCLHSKSCS